MSVKIIYVNVNEDGGEYDWHDTVEAALSVQAQFPNDSVEVRRETVEEPVQS